MTKTNNKMKKVFSVLGALAVTALLLSSCLIRFNGKSISGKEGKMIRGSKNYVTKTVEIGDFNTLNVAGSIVVYYENGPAGAEICAPDNIIEYVNVVNKDNKLDIGFDGKSVVSYDSLVVRVSGGPINSVSLSGSGDIVCKDIAVAQDSVSVTLAGSGDIDISSVKASECNISVAGSGDVEIGAIEAKNLSVSVSGSGDIEISDINAENVNASIGGSGEIELSGTALKAKYRVLGSGHINAGRLDAGEAKVLRKGSGKILYKVVGKKIKCED